MHNCMVSLNLWLLSKHTEECSSILQKKNIMSDLVTESCGSDIAGY